MKSFAYIVCWDDVHYNVVDNIEKQFIDCGQPHKIINSGDMKRDHWDNVGDIRYFRQFYKALKEFDRSYDYMIFICGDVSYDRWSEFLSRANRVLTRYKNIPIYAPHFTNDPWFEGATSLEEFNTDKNLLISTNTNGIMYYIRKDMVDILLEYFEHLNENEGLENLISGWGIDTVGSTMAIMLGGLVVRDKEHIIEHPKGSSYVHDRASHERNLVQKNFYSFCELKGWDVEKAKKIELDMYRRMGRQADTMNLGAFYSPSIKPVDSREINYHIIHINDERKTNRDHIDDVLKSNKVNIPSLNAKNPVALQEFKEKYPEVKPAWVEPKPGEFGNFASHYLAWKYLADSNLENLLVFEDDTLIEWNFIEKYNLAFDNVPDDYDVLSIFVHPNQYDRFDKTHEISYYVSKGYQDWSTLCYLISKQGAKKIVEYVKQHGMTRPTDWFIFRGGHENIFNVYTLPPHFGSPVSIDTRYESQVQ